MNLLEAIFPCFNSIEEPAFNDKAGHAQSAEASSVNGEKMSLHSKDYEISEDEVATNVLSILFRADKPADVHRQLRDQIHAYGWTETLARRVLDGLVNAINAGLAMGGAMKEAFDRASSEAEKFVHEHPVLTAVIVTLVAMAILYMLMPWVISALGFGELGPIEGLFSLAMDSSEIWCANWTKARSLLGGNPPFQTFPTVPSSRGSRGSGCHWASDVHWGELND